MQLLIVQSLAVFASIAGLTQAANEFHLQFYDQQFRKGSTIGAFSDNYRCVNDMPSGWNDRVRSATIINSGDRSATCFFYNDRECKGLTHAYDVTADDHYTININQIPAKYDAKWSSWRCSP